MMGPAATRMKACDWLPAQAFEIENVSSCDSTSTNYHSLKHCIVFRLLLSIRNMADMKKPAAKKPRAKPTHPPYVVRLFGSLLAAILCIA